MVERKNYRINTLNKLTLYLNLAMGQPCTSPPAMTAGSPSVWSTQSCCRCLMYIVFQKRKSDRDEHNPKSGTKHSNVSSSSSSDKIK